MGILKLPCFLLYLFLPIISATNCSISACGSLKIRFPFRLNENPLSCGYPGFSLTCKTPHNNTILTLPGSGGFLVREINYLTQSMLVYDPVKCLQKRLIRFNLSDSPFMANLSTNYTLFSCPRQFERLGFPTISCLSNATTSVLAVLNGTFVGAMVSKRCQKMVTLMVPGGKSTGLLTGNIDLELKWNLPQCEDCEGNGGMCGFDEQKQIMCYSHPSKGGSKEASTGVQVFKIIALSIAIPATICAIGVGVFLCLLDNSISQQTAVNPQPALTNEGLDQATIDTYTKVVLGESKRVPGPNDDTCPICLSEFYPKETLRCIPECQHCFHSDCIDEWLRIKGSCPLCRKLPSPVHQS